MVSVFGQLNRKLFVLKGRIRIFVNFYISKFLLYFFKLPKYIAQIIVSGAQAVGRAFARAVREEVKGEKFRRFFKNIKNFYAIFSASRQAAARDSPGTSGEGKENIRKRAATNTRLGLNLQAKNFPNHIFS